MPRPRILRRADMLKKVRAPAPRKLRRKPPLHVEQVLAWAKEHQQRTGAWPSKRSGEVRGVPFQTWYGIEKALNQGLRGLPSGLTLVRLLGKRLGVRNKKRPPPLSINLILDWADRHRARTGKWPTVSSGPLVDVPEESWIGLDRALVLGTRSLKPGNTLARLLFRHRGVSNANRPPSLTLEQILRWADAHHPRTGQWPHSGSGPVVGPAGENWKLISETLAQCTRNVPKGWTLTRLLHEKRRARMLRSPPRLT